MYAHLFARWLYRPTPSAAVVEMASKISATKLKCAGTDCTVLLTLVPEVLVFSCAKQHLYCSMCVMRWLSACDTRVAFFAEVGSGRVTCPCGAAGCKMELWVKSSTLTGTSFAPVPWSACVRWDSANVWKMTSSIGQLMSDAMLEHARQYARRTEVTYIHGVHCDPQFSGSPFHTLYKVLLPHTSSSSIPQHAWLTPRHCPDGVLRSFHAMVAPVFAPKQQRVSVLHLECRSLYSASDKTLQCPDCGFAASTQEPWRLVLHAFSAKCPRALVQEGLAVQPSCVPCTQCQPNTACPGFEAWIWHQAMYHADDFRPVTPKPRAPKRPREEAPPSDKSDAKRHQSAPPDTAVMIARLHVIHTVPLELAIMQEALTIVEHLWKSAPFEMLGMTLQPMPDAQTISKRYRECVRRYQSVSKCVHASEMAHVELRLTFAACVS